MNAEMAAQPDTPAIGSRFAGLADQLADEQPHWPSWTAAALSGSDRTIIKAPPARQDYADSCRHLQ